MNQIPILPPLLVAMLLLISVPGRDLRTPLSAMEQKPAAAADGRSTRDVSGQHWQMEGIRPGQGVHEGFREFFGEIAANSYNWNGAEVPGDVYTDLWRAGEIDDPHYGRNDMWTRWVMEKE